jgi:hypothetical protein
LIITEHPEIVGYGNNDLRITLERLVFTFAALYIDRSTIGMKICYRFYSGETVSHCRCKSGRYSPVSGTEGSGELRVDTIYPVTVRLKGIETQLMVDDKKDNQA